MLYSSIHCIEYNKLRSNISNIHNHDIHATNSYNHRTYLASMGPTQYVGNHPIVSSYSFPMRFKNIVIACTKTLLHLNIVSNTSLATFTGPQTYALVVYEATSRAL